MYLSQLLALAPGEFVFSRDFLAYLIVQQFQRLLFSGCLFLKKEVVRRKFELIIKCIYLFLFSRIPVGRRTFI